MERTEPITYNVPTPRLRGLNEEKRAQALEDYIRENSRQMRMILSRLEEMIRDSETRAGKEEP